MTKTSMVVERAPALPDRVAQALREQIMSGDLSPGEQLPVEQQLVEQFRVSRSVIREAISRLKHDGLVETFQGRGAFVSSQARSRSFRIDLSSENERMELTQVFELRMMIEAGAARLAAARRTGEHLRAMQQALEDIRAAAENRGDLVEADVRFHEAIAKASGNRHIEGFVLFVDAQLRASIRATMTEQAKDAERAEALYREHLAIYEAIAQRDPDRAQAAAAAHLTQAARELSLSIFGSPEAELQHDAAASKPRKRKAASPRNAAR